MYNEFPIQSTEFKEICYNTEKFNPNFTLIITHRNRLSFLRRLIFSQPFRINIMIVDASSPEVQIELDKFLRTLNYLNTHITCIFFKENSDLAKCIYTGASLAKTEFVSLISEDDLVDASKLLKYSKILKNNSSLSVVLGKFFYFSTISNSVMGSIQSINIETMTEFSYMQDSFFERLISQAKTKDSTLTTFGVMRKELLELSWKSSTYARFPLTHKMSEVLASRIALIEGKILLIDEVFCYRQMHFQNNARIGDTRFTTLEPKFFYKRTKTFDDWIDMNISHQFISLGEQMADYALKYKGTDAASLIKIYLILKWKDLIFNMQVDLPKNLQSYAISDKQYFFEKRKFNDVYTKYKKRFFSWRTNNNFLRIKFLFIFYLNYLTGRKPLDKDAYIFLTSAVRG